MSVAKKIRIAISHLFVDTEVMIDAIDHGLSMKKTPLNRWRCLRVLLLGAVGWWGVGCHREAIVSSSTPSNSASTSLPEECTEDDKAIISVVLEHFRQEEITKHPSANGKKMTIIIDAESLGPLGLSQDQFKSELRDVGWELPTAMFDRLRERNRQIFSLANLKGMQDVVVEMLGTSPDVTFFLPSFKEKYPDAIAIINLWMPAYSKDKTLALVRFHFGPTAHGACATYLLVKSQGRWTVKHSKFAYYM